MRQETAGVTEALLESAKKEFKETFSGSKEIIKDSVKLAVIEGSEKAKGDVLEDLEAKGVNLEALLQK